MRLENPTDASLAASLVRHIDSDNRRGVLDHLGDLCLESVTFDAGRRP